MRLIDADALPVKHGVDVGRDFGGLKAIVLKRDIDNAPTIDPVKHGEWIAVEYNDGTVRTECSVCGYGRGLPPVRNYCPNCGAQMERSEDA